jgi:hypothetical protein
MADDITYPLRLVDIVDRLRHVAVQESKNGWAVFPVCDQAADEIERLRALAEALYEECKRCGTKHDVKATNDWADYDQAVRGE